MTREAINELKKYTLGKKNTEKVEISVLQLNRVIKALEQEPKIGHWINGNSICPCCGENKFSAEIEKQERWLDCAGYNAYNVDIAFNSIKRVLKEARCEE